LILLHVRPPNNSTALPAGWSLEVLGFRIPVIRRPGSLPDETGKYGRGFVGLAAPSDPAGCANACSVCRARRLKNLRLRIEKTSMPSAAIPLLSGIFPGLQQFLAFGAPVALLRNRGCGGGWKPPCSHHVFCSPGKSFVAYSIHCTIVEVPEMSEALRRRGLPGYLDLVPWADPYIASLVEKVQSEGGRLLGRPAPAASRAECPPPSFGNFGNPSRDTASWPRSVSRARRVE
jgi:hypothetical protein